MKKSLIKKTIKLTRQTIIKALTETKNCEIIADGVYILNTVLKNNFFLKIIILMINKEGITPELFIRYLVTSQSSIASNIYFFNSELKKIQNLSAINDFFTQLAIKSAIKSPVELNLQNIFKSGAKVIKEIPNLDTERAKKYYYFSNLIADLLQSLAIFSHKEKPNNYYSFGYYLSLYYLLNREKLARKTKNPSLLDQWDNLDFTITKLKIMKNYINFASKIYPLEFNNFILLINKMINEQKNSL